MSQGRICMLVHHYFPRDVRVRREARALLEAGYDVTVFCLRDGGQPARDSWQGIRVIRLPVKRHRGWPLPVYLAEYAAFTGLSGMAMTAAHWRRAFDVVHVHTPPDFLLAAGVVARAMGARLVVDIHDLTPELYNTRFQGRGGNLAYQSMVGVEQAACSLADKVITVTDVFAQRLVERGVAEEQLLVVHNCPDEALFDPSLRKAGTGETDGALRIVHHGTLVQRYGVDVLVEAFSRIAADFPRARLDIYGEGDAEIRIRELIQTHELAGRVRLHGDVPQETIVDALAAADLCVVPNRDDPFTDLLLPTKMLEAMRMGCPVIASGTSCVKHYFPKGPRLVTPGDADDLARALLELIPDPVGRHRLAQAGQKAVASMAWQTEKQKLVDLVAELI